MFTYMLFALSLASAQDMITGPESISCANMQLPAGPFMLQEPNENCRLKPHYTVIKNESRTCLWLNTGLSTMTVTAFDGPNMVGVGEFTVDGWRYCLPSQASVFGIAPSSDALGAIGYEVDPNKSWTDGIPMTVQVAPGQYRPVRVMNDADAGNGFAPAKAARVFTCKVITREPSDLQPDEVTKVKMIVYSDQPLNSSCTRN